MPKYRKTKKDPKARKAAEVKKQRESKLRRILREEAESLERRRGNGNPDRR